MRDEFIQPAFNLLGHSSADLRDLPPFDACLLALNGVKGLGMRGLRALALSLGSGLGLIWDTEPESIAKILEKAGNHNVEAVVRQLQRDRDLLLQHGEDERDGLLERKIRVIPGPELPCQLLNIPEPPAWLFVQGNEKALYQRPAVAVVGTRHPSPEGIRAAGIVAGMLSAYPVVLVSGLAEGIDAEAHRRSLAEGATNIAFLGHGINLIFPAGTAAIRERIVEGGGAVATEYMPDQRYQRSFFVERNRLQAGLADLVIPVEAQAASGTAHTVGFAKQYGRRIVGVRTNGHNGLSSVLAQDGYEVFAVLTAAGCRNLDSILRSTAEAAGHYTYSLSVAERRLLSEMRCRDVRREDIERLIRALHASNTEE